MINFFEKPADNSVKPVEFQVFKIFLFLSRLNFVSVDFPDFYWILSKFWKFDGFATFRILKSRRILKHCSSPNLDPSGPRSKPAIIGLCRRCLGGACAAFEEPTPPWSRARIGATLEELAPPWSGARTALEEPVPPWSGAHAVLDEPATWPVRQDQALDVPTPPGLGQPPVQTEVECHRLLPAPWLSAVVGHASPPWSYVMAGRRGATPAPARTKVSREKR
jgi:hypothetical protein